MSNGFRPEDILRPLVRAPHAPYRVEEGRRIRLGGVVAGVAAELKDDTGAVWKLLELMDGTRERPELVDALKASFPHLQARSILAAVDGLIMGGYVEDASAPQPNLSVRELERYDRSMSYFRWTDREPSRSPWRSQLMLKHSRVSLLGLGGTGGVAASALAMSGVGTLRVFDADCVEVSNLNRQVLYSEDDVGSLKVDAALARLRSQNQDIEIDGACVRVERREDFDPLLSDCDLFVLCADTPRDLRRWANQSAIQAQVPWVDAGYHGPLTQVALYVPGDGPCWRCNLYDLEARHAAIGARPLDGRDIRAPATARAVNAVAAYMSGTLAAHAALAFLTGSPPMQYGLVTGINLMKLTAPPVVSSGARWTECPECAQLAARKPQNDH